MSKLTILQRVITLFALFFVISTSIGVYLLNNKLSNEFTHQYLDSHSVITNNLSEEIVNGVRFNKASIVTGAFEKLSSNYESFSGGVVVNMNNELLVSSLEGDVELVDGIVQLRENQALTNTTVGSKLYQKSPVVHAKSETQVGWLLVQWDLTPLQSSLSSILISIFITMAVSMLLVSVMIVWALNQQVIKPLKIVSNLAAGLNSGNADLTARIKEIGTPELKVLSRSVNGFVERLQNMISQIKQLGQEQSNSIQLSMNSAGQVKENLLEKDKKLVEVLNSVEELSNKTNQNSENVTSVTQYVKDASEMSVTGIKNVEENKALASQLSNEISSAAAAVENLSNISEQVSSVLDVIRSIADQTNLLALNAAIEAARAGEQGRGFAVVADEVRALAGKTQASTEEIREQIEELLSGSGHAVKTMEKSSEFANESLGQAENLVTIFNNIADEVSQIDAFNNEILKTTTEQSSIAQNASGFVSEIQQASTVSNELSVQNIDQSVIVNDKFESMQEILQKFKC